MKRRISLFLILVMLFSIPVSSVSAVTTFPDVTGHWAEEEITYLQFNLGLIGGYPDGTFKPANPITRAEVAKIIAVEQGLTLQPASYSDVSASHWANIYIGAATAVGIMGGYPNGEFKPNNPMTRAEVAKVLAVTYEFTVPPAAPMFSDVSSTHWAFDHIEALAAYYITVGYPDGTFKPSNSITRAEFAVFLARTLDPFFTQPLTLLTLTFDVIEILQDEDLTDLQPYIHPVKGVRFSPYEYVENSHLIFNIGSLPGLLSETTVYNWGTEDGTGDPILKTPQQYFDRYVNNKDYTTPDDIQINTLIGRGSLINNIPTFYPSGTFVEFHVEGTTTYGGMDWGSTYVVFENYNNIWYVVAIVHGEWTT